MRNTNLVGINFNHSLLIFSRFIGSILSDIDFQNSDLSGANFTRAILVKNVNFIAAKFSDETILPFSKEEALKQGMIYIPSQK